LSRAAAVAVALAAAAASACIPEHGSLMRPGENCLECHGGGGLPGEALTVENRESARRWTIAGTVFPTTNAAPSEGVRGAKIHVRDAGGKTFTLETNGAGNFFTAEPVQFPLRVSLEHGGVVHEMEPEVPYGGCNACHRLPPRQDAPGRISVTGGGDDFDEGPLMLPGENCLECHGGSLLPGEPATIAQPRTAPRWTVAGTVFESENGGSGVAGAKVHLTDALGATLTLETNLAGNFYTAEPLQFPLRAAVEYGGLLHDMEPDVPYGGCNGCHRLPPRQDAPGRVTIPTADGEDE
jgi:hypothetical protein